MEILIGVLATTIIFVGLLSLIVWIGKKLSKLNARQRKGWLLAHILFVIMYFGGLLGVTILAVSTKFITDADLIYAAHYYIQFFDWFLIIPGGMGALITGIMLAVRTNWGFAKHYWIIAKWAVNVFAIVYGGNFMRIVFHDNFYIIFDENIHPLYNQVYLANQQMLLWGIAICYVMLIFLVAISYYKPWGIRKSKQPVNPTGIIN